MTVWSARRTPGARLGWRLAVAVSGVTLSLAACAGHSEKTGAERGSGGTAASSAMGGSGGSGAKGGSGARGGSGGTDTTGRAGSGSDAGQGGAPPRGGAPGAGRASNAGAGNGGDSGEAGSGGSAGSDAGAGNAGTGGGGNVKPHGCVALPGSLAPYACEGPFKHHPAGAECALPPHPEPEAGGAAGASSEPQAGGAAGAGSEPPVGDFSACTVDADCTAKPNGYCLLWNGWDGPFSACHYPCHDDSDCDSDELCSCDAFVSNVNGESLVLGVCKSTTCRSDADCGPGLLCISPVIGACAGEESYSCQTAGDQCGGPGDCPSGNRLCSAESGQFVCSEGSVC